MTIREYIKKKMKIWSINNWPDDLISLELEAVGHEPEAEMTNDINTDNFFYKVLPELLLTPTSISQGGFSASYDKNQMMQYYSLVANRLNKPNQLNQNTLTDITKKWR